MILHRKQIWLAAMLTFAAASIHASSNKPPERSRVAFSHALPQLDGDHLEANIVEVYYGPGESSLPHSHPCPVLVYVLEGVVRMQVKGEPEAVYTVGQSFYEAPNGTHQISANASKEKPARFLAYFVCDHETPLSTHPGGK